MVVAQYYTRISTARLAQLLDQPAEEVREWLCTYTHIYLYHDAIVLIVGAVHSGLFCMAVGVGFVTVACCW